MWRHMSLSHWLMFCHPAALRLCCSLVFYSFTPFLWKGDQRKEWWVIKKKRTCCFIQYSLKPLRISNCSWEGFFMSATSWKDQSWWEVSFSKPSGSWKMQSPSSALLSARHYYLSSLNNCGSMILVGMNQCLLKYSRSLYLHRFLLDTTPTHSRLYCEQGERDIPVAFQWWHSE